MISGMFGSHYVPARRWTPQLEISPDTVGMVPPIELRVDPYLPTIAVDPFDPAHAIAIPTGRFLAIGYQSGRGSNQYRQTLSDAGKAVLTIHDGKNLTPVGMSVNQMYKDTVSTEPWSGQAFMTDSNAVKFKKDFVAEVPFVLAINNAHGTIQSGDKLTGYWGSTTSLTNVSTLHRGKPVKWTPKAIRTATGAASAIQNLPAAIYPGIEPQVLMAFAGGSLLTTVTATVSWNGANWVASFAGAGSSTVTTVVYAYGQDADQIAGEALRIQSLQDMLNRDDFLRWVEYAPSDSLNFPPAMQRVPVTQVTNATPNTVVANSVYRVPNYPMSIHHQVLVQITDATLTDKDGNVSTYDSAQGQWFTLPTQILDNRGAFIGLYHSVNWLTGVITLASNIAPKAGSSNIQIRVSYAYITDPREGAVLWGGGIIGLTDGRNVSTTNQYGQTVPGYGTPAHLNLPDVIGAMRLVVR
jgi:hypothetical protein